MLSRVRNISQTIISMLELFTRIFTSFTISVSYGNISEIEICQVMFFPTGEIHFSSTPFFKKKSEKFSFGNPYGGFPSNLADIPTKTKISYFRFVISSRLETRANSSDQKGVSKKKYLLMPINSELLETKLTVHN